MSIPEQQQIDYWLKNANERINRKHQLYNEKFYEKENIPIQSHYTGLGLWHASLARAKFLNGDPIEEVRAEFAKASQCIMKSFTMAYDKSDPDYQGEKIEWSSVSETKAIRGMNYALMSGNFDLSCEIASWFQDRLDGHKMDLCVNRYAHALSLMLQNKPDEAIPFLANQLNDYNKRPPKSIGDKNYYSLILTLLSIIKNDEKKFNKGLLKQLEIYQSQAQGELKDTDEEFICDHSVALANIGIKLGLKVTVEYDTLPKGLLIKA